MLQAMVVTFDDCMRGNVRIRCRKYIGAVQSLTYCGKVLHKTKLAFPAITICPETLADSRKLDLQKLEDHIRFKNYTAGDMKLYDYGSQICDRELAETFSKVDIIENATDLYKTLHDVKLKSLCYY